MENKVKMDFKGAKIKSFSFMQKRFIKFKEIIFTWNLVEKKNISKNLHCFMCFKKKKQKPLLENK